MKYKLATRFSNKKKKMVGEHRGHVGVIQFYGDLIDPNSRKVYKVHNALEAFLVVCPG